MPHSIWNIGEISYAGECKDRAGHKTLNGSSYQVELVSPAERLKVEVAVTGLASRYAADRLHEAASVRAGDSQEVDRELVRCFVEEELSDEQWEPRKTPWLTIDSEDVPEIVDRLMSVVALA